MLHLKKSDQNVLSATKGKNFLPLENIIFYFIYLFFFFFGHILTFACSKLLIKTNIQSPYDQCMIVK